MKQKGFAPILVLIGIVVIATVGGAYFFGKSQIPKPQTQNQIVVSQTPQPTIVVSSPPNEIADWTKKTSTACNVVFSIPPQKAPYYTPDDPNTSPDTVEDGAFWQIQEYNDENNLFKNSIRALFSNPKVAGSGNIPGMVAVSCSPNSEKYTSESLLEKYKANFKDGTYAGIEIAGVKNISLWGRKVYAVYVKGGMFDELNPNYLFATDKHIYLVGKAAMSSNSTVKEATETIFNNLEFNN